MHLARQYDEYSPARALHSEQRIYWHPGQQFKSQWQPLARPLGFTVGRNQARSVGVGNELDPVDLARPSIRTIKQCWWLTGLRSLQLSAVCYRRSDFLPQDFISAGTKPHEHSVNRNS